RGLHRPSSSALRRFAAARMREAMHVRSVNPATGEIVATYPQDSPSVVEAKLAAARAAAREWARTSFADRAEALRRLAARLRQRHKEFARAMALEMGKPVSQGS